MVRENPDGTYEIMDKKDFINTHEEYNIHTTSPEGKTE